MTRLPTDPGSLSIDMYTLVRQAVTDAGEVADKVQGLADDTRRRQSRGLGAGGSALALAFFLAWQAYSGLTAKIDTAVAAQTKAAQIAHSNSLSLSALWREVLGRSQTTPGRIMPPISDATTGPTN